MYHLCLLNAKKDVKKKGHVNRIKRVELKK